MEFEEVSARTFLDPEEIKILQKEADLQTEFNKKITKNKEEIKAWEVQDMLDSCLREGINILISAHKERERENNV